MPLFGRKRKEQRYVSLYVVRIPGYEIMQIPLPTDIEDIKCACIPVTLLDGIDIRWGRLHAHPRKARR